jgi:hypothetical protein
MRRYCAHELGMKVIAVDDMSGGFASNIPTRVEFVKGDLQVFVSGAVSPPIQSI